MGQVRLREMYTKWNGVLIERTNVTEQVFYSLRFTSSQECCLVETTHLYPPYFHESRCLKEGRIYEQNVMQVVHIKRYKLFQDLKDYLLSLWGHRELLSFANQGKQQFTLCIKVENFEGALPMP